MEVFSVLLRVSVSIVFLFPLLLVGKRIFIHIVLDFGAMCFFVLLWQFMYFGNLFVRNVNDLHLIQLNATRKQYPPLGIVR